MDGAQVGEGAPHLAVDAAGTEDTEAIGEDGSVESGGDEGGQNGLEVEFAVPGSDATETTGDAGVVGGDEGAGEAGDGGEIFEGIDGFVEVGLDGVVADGEVGAAQGGMDLGEGGAGEGDAGSGDEGEDDAGVFGFGEQLAQGGDEAIAIGGHGLFVLGHLAAVVGGFESGGSQEADVVDAEVGAGLDELKEVGGGMGVAGEFAEIGVAALETVGGDGIAEFVKAGDVAGILEESAFGVAAGQADIFESGGGDAGEGTGEGEAVAGVGEC